MIKITLSQGPWQYVLELLTVKSGLVRKVLNELKDRMKSFIEVIESLQEIHLTVKA